MFNEEDSAADLAVVGLGPGGLAAVLQAAKNGKNVVAFTNRSEYIRGQRVALTASTINFLNENSNPSDPKDIEFLRRLEAEKTVQTKDLERFIYSKIEHMPNVQIVQTGKDSKLRLGTGTDKTANCIQTPDGKQYYCRNILAADGARHAFANEVSATLGVNLPYKVTNEQERHRYHAVVQLKIKEGCYEGAPMPPTSPGFEQLLAYNKQGWNHSYLPKYYLFCNEQRTKFYYAGEVPKEIFDAPRESSDPDMKTRGQLLKSWASTVIYEKYGVPEEELEYRKSKKNQAKDLIQDTVFEMDMHVCEEKLVNLTNGVFSQIGDARRIPNYRLGHGLNDAVRGGISFANALSPTAFDREAYLQTIEQMDASVADRMQQSKEHEEEAVPYVRNKILETIDSLIARLTVEAKKNEETILKLQAGKLQFQKQDNIIDLIKVVNDVRPALQDHHEHTGLFYQLLRWVSSLFSLQATETKSVRMLNDITEDMNLYTMRKSVP